MLQVMMDWTKRFLGQSCFVGLQLRSHVQECLCRLEATLPEWIFDLLLELHGASLGVEWEMFVGLLGVEKMFSGM